MISLATFLVGAALVAAITVYFWPQIVFFCKNYLIKWIRNNISDSAGKLFTEILLYFDEPACFGRRKAREVWKWLKQTIASMVSFFIEKNDGTYVERRESTIYDAQKGNYKVITLERPLAYEDLPSDIRHELNRRNTRSFKNDKDKQILLDHFVEKAKKKGDLTDADIMEMTY